MGKTRSTYRRSQQRRKRKKTGAKTKASAKPRPTAKKNARAIKQLFRMSDPKFVYRNFDNEFVNDSLTFTQLELTNLASNVDPAVDPRQFNYREADSMQVRLRNMRIHFTVHVVPHEGQHLQKIWVGLIKTTNGIGSASGINLPRVSSVWDPQSGVATAGNLLAPWEGFRLTQGQPSGVAPAPTQGDTLLNTTILKQWTCYLCPQGGDCEVAGLTTNNASVPSAEAGTYNSINSPAGQNINYTQGRVSSRYFAYTHKCLNAQLKFESATSTRATNVRYYLVALSQDSDTHHGFRLNASCKINYYDN